MLSLLKLTLQSDKPIERSDCLGPMLHGALMELLPEEVAEVLHSSSTHPFSQYVISDLKESKVTWCISTVNRTAREEVLNRLRGISDFSLRYKDIHLHVVGSEEKQIEKDAFLRDYLLHDRERMIRVSFLSPTTFKQNDEYVLFPTVRLMLQSLMSKYDVSSEDGTSVVDEQVLKDLENNVRIVGYRLRSAKYQVGGARIPSFVGDVTLKVFGPQQMVNLVWMLLKYGEYSGMGIKCALGMGAINISGGERNSEHNRYGSTDVSNRNLEEESSSSETDEEPIQQTE